MRSSTKSKCEFIREKCRNEYGGICEIDGFIEIVGTNLAANYHTLNEEKDNK